MKARPPRSTWCIRARVESRNTRRLVRGEAAGESVGTLNETAFWGFGDVAAWAPDMDDWDVFATLNVAVDEDDDVVGDSARLEPCTLNATELTELTDDNDDTYPKEFGRDGLCAGAAATTSAGTGRG